MKKYKPKSEKQDIIRHLLAMGIKVTATGDNITKIECDESQLQEVKQITKMDFEEIK